MQKNVFLTGSTGLVGRELLGRILLREPETHLKLLVRPQAGKSAGQRLTSIMQDTLGSRLDEDLLRRVQPIEGDLQLPRFGLGDSTYEDLASSVSEIIHCGASTNLGQSLELARSANVAGTATVVELAKLASKTNAHLKLRHVSTAFVAGDTGRTVCPDELSLSGPFRNGYEQSKAEAESLILALAEEGSCGITIFRPSMIVGDSVTGQTSTFNVIYILARFLMRGIVSLVPAKPHAPFDIVPVDYVADALYYLRKNTDKPLESFHLTAGLGRETSPSEILEVIIQLLHSYRKIGLSLLQTPRIVCPEETSRFMQSLTQANAHIKNVEQVIRKQLRFVNHVWHLIPYLTANPRFDASKTENLLAGTQLSAPLFRDYASRVFTYCLDTNWGKERWTNPANLQTWVEREAGLSLA